MFRLQHTRAVTGPGSVQRRVLLVLLSTAMIGLMLVASPSAGTSAWADTAPSDTSLPVTVSTDPLPTVQMDGVAWAQVVIGHTVYVGGEFTQARPAGAASGAQTQPRANLLAYNLTTGGLIAGFAPNPNGAVRSLAASPDGTKLYVGGTFTTIAGATRNRIAAFNAATGTLLTGFKASVNATVLGLSANASTVYLSGNFTTTLGNARNGVSAVDATTGALRPWAPVQSAGGTVRQVLVSPDSTKVILGGNFTTMNGSANPGYGLAAVDAVTGTTNITPFAVNAKVRNAQANSAIMSLAATSDGFYGSGYVFNRNQGNLEGVFKSDWNGNMVWVEDCHGDTYSVYPSGGAVYVAGHPHYCGNIGGFPQTTPTPTYQRGLAFSAGTATPLITKDPLGYYNWEGNPRPTLLSWFPDMNTGTFTGQTQGPWNVAGNADYVVYGGEFTQVNGKPQQGLVRFAKKSLAPNLDGPRLSGAGYKPTVRGFAQGVRVTASANYDRDNEELTYTLLRNGGVIGSPVTKRSTFWQRPNVSFFDATAAVGTAYSYRLRVSDPLGNTVMGDSVAFTPSGGPPVSTYDRAVLAGGPQAYWTLNDTSGTGVADSSGSDVGSRRAGVTSGVSGAIAGDGTAFRFNGTSTGFVSSGAAQRGLDELTVEAWFKTTTTTGGKIVGFGNSAAANSTAYDRQIYLNNAGLVYFGTNRGPIKTVNSATPYNNGQWHHALGTVGPKGMNLYLDGKLVGSRTDAVNAGLNTGYWRIGGDTLSGWPSNPTSGYFKGDIDQAAVYPEVLSSGTAAAHYALRSG